jgi:hypothetical protein
MGWRFRRVLTLGPLRWNFSRQGISMSVGSRICRLGVSASGKKYVTLTLPGTGLSWSSRIGGATTSPSGSGTSTSSRQSGRAKLLHPGLAATKQQTLAAKDPAIASHRVPILPGKTVPLRPMSPATPWWQQRGLTEEEA